MQSELINPTIKDQDSRVCHLLIDAAGSGAWNMAVDEALLESAAEESRLTLRFYRWEEPTLSLGYFQRYADREQHPTSLDCPVVRRSSGGGAILHDQEWTYSLCVPASHALAASPQVLYDQVHQALVAVLFGAAQKLGSHELELCAETSDEPQSDDPWLCFERRSPGDVLLEGAKITGSAQRRRRGAVLQHGSVLLRRSAAAPELPGLFELAGFEVGDQVEFLRLWAVELEKRLGLEIKRGFPPEDLINRARHLETEKYGCASWTRRR